MAIIALGERERPNASRQAVFRSGVEVVALPVTVTDSSGRTVPNPSPEHFTITEDGVAQSLSVLSNALQPVALAVLVDTSASMRGDRWDAALAAVSAIGRALAPEDQWSLSVFADRVTPVSPWGRIVPSTWSGCGRMAPLVERGGSMRWSRPRRPSQLRPRSRGSRGRDSPGPTNGRRRVDRKDGCGPAGGGAVDHRIATAVDTGLLAASTSRRPVSAGQGERERSGRSREASHRIRRRQALGPIGEER